MGGKDSVSWQKGKSVCVGYRRYISKGNKGTSKIHYRKKPGRKGGGENGGYLPGKKSSNVYSENRHNKNQGPIYIRKGGKVLDMVLGLGDEM